MNSFFRGMALASGASFIVTLALIGMYLFEPPSCDAVKADAEAHIQAVSACASVPGCTLTADHIRVALEKKAAAESCQ